MINVNVLLVEKRELSISLAIFFFRVKREGKFFVYLGK